MNLLFILHLIPERLIAKLGAGHKYLTVPTRFGFLFFQYLTCQAVGDFNILFLLPFCFSCNASNVLSKYLHVFLSIHLFMNQSFDHFISRSFLQSVLTNLLSVQSFIQNSQRHPDM